MYHCTKCKITWAALHTQDDENGDEQYEYCPVCMTDMFLTNVQDGDGYIYCAITGKIINVSTGKVMEEKKEIDYVPPKPFDRESWQKKNEEFEKKVDRAIAAYHEVFESEGGEAAKKIYKEILKNK